MEEKRGTEACPAIAAICGVVVFIILYGIKVLNPTYDAWLLSGGDLMQHYLGWCFYRRGDWTFPIGLTDQLAYPSYSSVIFTDSIPLFAVIFKLLSPFLPQTFQYFGLWGVMSFGLNGYFAAKILKYLDLDNAEAIIGSVFFILSPVVLEKMFRHTALGGHFVVLFAVYLYVSHRKTYRDIKKSSFCWGVLGFLVASVHLYYLPMCGMLLGGYILCSLIFGYIDKQKPKVAYLLPCASFMAVLFVSVWVLGGFSSKASQEGDGLGRFSFNLNGFFNAKGYSIFFDALPTYKDGQYEGFAYLGLGLFLLLGVTIVYLIRYLVMCMRKKEMRLHNGTGIYIAVAVMMSAGLILFAASPEISWGAELLFEVPYSSTLYHYWGMFRSTGRIIWPVIYLIYVGAIYCGVHIFGTSNKTRKVAAILLLVCLAAQILDLSGKLGELNRKYRAEAVYESPLQSDVWDKIVSAGCVEHIVWASVNFDNGEIMDIAKYALDNHMTMNTYYFARGININENTKYSVENPNDTCVYIFRTTDNDNDRYDPRELPLHLCEADGYLVGTTFVLK